jgi:Ras family.
MNNWADEVQCAHSNNNLKTVSSASLVVSPKRMSIPKIHSFPYSLKLSFLPCLTSLVIRMCDCNVRHGVAILLHDTVQLHLVHQKVWRFKSSGMWCCVTGWVISAAHGKFLPGTTVLKSPKTSSLTALLWEPQISHQKVWLDKSQFFLFQHANEDVEKMILGNKNDMEEKRVVSRERGEAVSIVTERWVSEWSSEYWNI